jgi:hypothetical protein
MKKSYIENIRKYVKDKGYVPNSDIIKEAINTICPDGENILENKPAIVDEVIRLLTLPSQIELVSETEIKDTLPTQEPAIVQEVEPSIGQVIESSTQTISNNSIPEADTTILQVEPEQEQESGIVVSEGEKQELITTQSSILDVQLSELETIELCSQIPDVFDDYKSFVDSVTSAIKAFVDDKFDHQETNTVEDSISELRQHIAVRQARLDTKFAQGLNDVKGDLEQIRSNIKSRQSAILERFRIPAQT